MTLYKRQGSRPSLILTKEKEMHKSKMTVWGGLTNSCEKKRHEKKRIKGMIYPFKYRVPKKSKER